MNFKRSFYTLGVTKLIFVFPGSAYLLISFQFHTLCTILLFIVIQSTDFMRQILHFLILYMILALLFGNGNSIHISMKRFYTRGECLIGMC